MTCHLRLHQSTTADVLRWTEDMKAIRGPVPSGGGWVPDSFGGAVVTFDGDPVATISRENGRYRAFDLGGRELAIEQRDGLEFIAEQIWTSHRVAARAAQQAAAE